MPLVIAVFTQLAIGLHAIVSNVLAEAITPWISCLAACMWGYVELVALLALVIFDVVSPVMYHVIANVRSCPLLRHGERIGWHIVALMVWTLLCYLPRSMI